MRKSLSFFILLMLALFLGAGRPAVAMAAGDTSAPEQAEQKIHLLPAGKPFYIVAYFEAGPYWEFADILHALQDALAKSGYGKKLAFPQRYHYSPGWDLPDEKYEAIAQSIMSDPEIDMVVALGSVASKSLLEYNNNKTPVICLDVANPALIGLIDPETQQPSAENFFVDYVPNKWGKSIATMDILQRITKIGTLSNDTEEGRTYCNIKELREVSRERGFDVVFYDKLDLQESVASCKKGIEFLLDQGVDAIYIPAINCFDPERGDPAMLYDMIHARGVKSYAKDGKVPVRNGALIGISTLHYQSVGTFFANIMLQHVIPGMEATQKRLPFEPRIYLNRTTAHRLNITFPLSLLSNVDGIYDSTLPAIKKWP